MFYGNKKKLGVAEEIKNKEKVALLARNMFTVSGFN